MPLKESKYKNYILIGAIAYFFLIIISLHMGHVLYLKQPAKPIEAIQFGMSAVQSSYSMEINWLTLFFEGLQNFARNPFACFPTTWHVIIPMIFFLVIDVFFVGLFITIEQTKPQINQNVVHGSAKWNTRYENYNTRFVIPYHEGNGLPFDPNVIISKRLKMAFDTQDVLKARYPNLTQLSKRKQEMLKSRAIDDGRNMNTLVIGGSGTGKSFRVIKPAIMQMNCSMIVTDPSGELLQCCGKSLMHHGCKVKVFSTSDMRHSNCYNPFDYVFDENGKVDEAKVTTMIFLFLKNAEGVGAAKQKSGDPFWDKSAKAFLSAIAYYLLENDSIDKPHINFTTMLKLTQCGKVSEQSDTSASHLDILMEEHRAKMAEQGKESKALSNYDTFKLAPGKTANSILISVAVDLQLFNNEDVKNLTRHDYDNEENNVSLDKIGDEQTALFINIPQANGTFNFLVSLMYSQMFDSLYTKAEKICPKKYMLKDQYGYPVITMLDSEEKAKKTLEMLKAATVETVKNKRGAVSYHLVSGKKVLKICPSKEAAEAILANVANYKVEKGKLRLPWHVRCLMDEFANIGEIPEFSEKLSTMRKYQISCTIVVQNIAQLKARYDKLFESIIGGCDTIIFLGSSENETCKYISDSLGDATADTRSISHSGGKSGKTSESHSKTKRKLMNPDEVKGMSNSECIVMIRGLNPFRDKKYSFLEHPRYKETGDYDRANAITEEFMDIYFNSTPLKTKKSSKKKQQKAVADVMGTTKYTKDTAGFNELMEENGVTAENIEQKLSAVADTKKNKKNKELSVEERKAAQEDLNAETKSMSDNVFLFC